MGLKCGMKVWTLTSRTVTTTISEVIKMRGAPPPPPRVLGAVGPLGGESYLRDRHTYFERNMDAWIKCMFW
jgi:hypothetical protein